MRSSLLSLLVLSSVTTSLAARRHFSIPERVGSTYMNARSELSANSLKARANEDPLTVAARHVEKIAPETTYELISDHYTDDDTGVTHAYFMQTVNGIRIENTQINVNVKPDGSILSAGSSFLQGNIKAPKLVRRNQQITPLEALQGVFEALNFPGSAENAEAVPVNSLTGNSESFSFTGVDGVTSVPTANLRYYQTPEGDLKLIWKLETFFDDNWLTTYADALEKGVVYTVMDNVFDAQYQVFPLGFNDLRDGPRQTLVNPHKTAFSPNGWHQAGTTSYTTTRGNNAIAQENFDGGSDFLNNGRPDGGTGLDFSFPYDPATTNPRNYINAAVTQLFYTINIYHDFLESLGFTEQSGNFEEVNTGTGGLGGDAVQVNAQDGSGFNNANFAVTSDGVRPRIRMYLWNGGTPQRDGDFDNGIIIHEYSHGLSTRLTGGPAAPGCLSTTESGGMGEGWGDFFGTAIRIKTTEDRTAEFKMGDWAGFGTGVRNFPYSTSMTTNPTTYSTINGAAYQAVHPTGSVWAEILYEVLWNLIEKHGNSAEIFPTFAPGSIVPTSGRTLAMKLALEGMKLQPCRPTFLSARDAIIDADLMLTEGDNYCELWRGFAKRGLGVNATQGTGSNRRIDGFEVPEECE